ncbi:MAG TPA: glycosyltransferase family 2 protein [Steroidobacter sp.]|uniref:glycosyltransferase family 2 protein n=1 Tax=Steroidobacter sp. TaxID=1978227 RepID=UPI002EDAD5EB
MSMSEPAHQPSRASISVIVPTYNSARFIREALDSILAQRLQPEQIIVIDDGSTDNTADVVGRYKDRRIQYIRQPHAGVASARNAGLDAARGEYIAFLDAHDRWRPIFLEMLHGYLSEDPTAGSIFSNFVRFEHGTGKVLGDQFHSYPAIKRPVLLKDEPFAHGRIPKEKAFSTLVAFEDIPAYPQVMMFRRSMIEHLRFDASPGEDIGFALKAFLAGGVLFTDVVLAEVRCHANAAPDPLATALNKLDGLKAIEPHVTREGDRRAYRDRLVKEHIDAALLQTKAGKVRAGWRTYRDSFSIPGSSWRKLKGAMRMALAVPSGLAR